MRALVWERDTQGYGRVVPFGNTSALAVYILWQTGKARNPPRYIDIRRNNAEWPWA